MRFLWSQKRSLLETCFYWWIPCQIKNTHIHTHSKHLPPTHWGTTICTVNAEERYSERARKYSYKYCNIAAIWKDINTRIIYRFRKGECKTILMSPKYSQYMWEYVCVFVVFTSLCWRGKLTNQQGKWVRKVRERQIKEEGVTNQVSDASWLDARVLIGSSRWDGSQRPASL